jgi:hypothetical protein
MYVWQIPKEMRGSVVLPPCPRVINEKEFTLVDDGLG